MARYPHACRNTCPIKGLQHVSLIQSVRRMREIFEVCRLSDLQCIQQGAYEVLVHRGKLVGDTFHALSMAFYFYLRLSQ